MMYTIQEHRSIEKIIRKIPSWIVKEYEVWKNLIYGHGPKILNQFPGYHDEPLKGDRKGQRSSRLSLKYRVIYGVDKSTITVYVLEITAHPY